MKLKLKRLDKTVPLPEYKPAKAAAFDVYARLDVEIPAGEVKVVPLNVALEIPKDHWVLLAARSSLHKRGLMPANGIGVGDEDFCGDNDEYGIPLLNFSKSTVKVEKGDRIAQMIIMPREKVEIEEVDHLGNADRGGFGSTGRK